MANSSNANGGTVLTIPPNSIWRGSVSLCATLAVAVGGSAATSYPDIRVSGSGGTWANDDYVLRLALFVPAVGVTALTGSMVTATINTGEIQVQSRANPLTLVLNFTTAGTSAVATAIGEFL